MFSYFLCILFCREWVRCPPRSEGFSRKVPKCLYCAGVIPLKTRQNAMSQSTKKAGLPLSLCTSPA